MQKRKNQKLNKEKNKKVEHIYFVFIYLDVSVYHTAGGGSLSHLIILFLF